MTDEGYFDELSTSVECGMKSRKTGDGRIRAKKQTYDLRVALSTSLTHFTNRALHRLLEDRVQKR